MRGMQSGLSPAHVLSSYPDQFLQFRRAQRLLVAELVGYQRDLREVLHRLHLEERLV